MSEPKAEYITSGQIAKLTTAPVTAPVVETAVEGEWYNLKKIAAMLGVGYDRLRGFADSEGMKDLLGSKLADDNRIRIYPHTAVEVLRGLMHAQNDGKVTPRTAASFLRLVAETGSGGAIAKNTNGLSANLPNGVQAGSAPAVTLREEDLLNAAAYGAAVGAERATLRQGERFLSITEAHAQYGVSVVALRKLSFLDGRRRRVRATHVIQYMEQFGPGK